jgi:hypothetical protein
MSQPQANAMPVQDTALSNWWKLAYFLPLIVAVAVLATHFIFYRKFLFCLGVPCSPFTAADIAAGVAPADQTKFAAYIARASWTLINGVHVLACVLAIVTASIVIYRSLAADYKDRKTRRIIILTVIALAADVALFLALWTAERDAYSPAQQLLRATVGQAHGLPGINKLNRWGDALSLTGTLCLAVAACATIWQRDVNKKLEADDVTQRVRLLRPVLYVGALMLVIAVLRLSATHAWAVAYLPADTDLGKAVASFTKGVIGTLGTVFTLLIAGIYLPAALMLQARVRKVAATQQSPEDFIKNNGMNLSVPAILVRAIILISPFLAGPLGERLVEATKALGV